MRVNHLVVTDKKKEDAADDILASLTKIAYLSPALEKQEIISKKKSRFFYKPTCSFKQDVDTKKTQIRKEKHPVDLIANEVNQRSDGYALELPESLQKNIIKVREFFLKEIGPRTLAAQGGTSQAHQVVQKTLNSEVDSTIFYQFQQMVRVASTLKMARFISSYLKLPPSNVDLLIQSMYPRTAKEATSPVTMPIERRTSRLRKTSNSSSEAKS